MRYLLKSIALVYMLILSSDSFSQVGIVFDESGYKAVLERSKAEKKPVFYMVYATWCSHCNKMKEEVFTDPEVASFMNKNFICAWQDLEKGEGTMLKNKFGIKSFPYFLFLDGDGTVLYNIMGEFKSAGLLAEAKLALDPMQQLPYLEKQFMENPSNHDKCVALMTALRKGREREDLSPYALTYLRTVSDAELISANNWKVIANGVNNIESREFQYVLKHQKEFAAVSSPTRVKKKIINIVSEYLRPSTESLDTITYNKRRPVAKSINMPVSDSLVFTYDLLINERTKNWKAYKKIAAASTEAYVYSDLKSVKAIAQNYLMNVEDLPSLRLAIKWALHTSELKESYESYLLIAKLYKKTKDIKQSIVYATKAKDLGKQMGWQAKDAEELLLTLGVK